MEFFSSFVTVPEMKLVCSLQPSVMYVTFKEQQSQINY